LLDYRGSTDLGIRDGTVSFTWFATVTPIPPHWPNWREVAGDEMQVTCSSHIYRTAARALALTVFKAPSIQSVCVRRSVASGEAVFPFSDMDFDITITSDSGLLIEELRKRYSLAKILFPRTGHCFVMTSADPNEISVTEPYRASINQRCFFHALGVPPPWPAHPIQPLEAARRVVFWLEYFFPTAVRRGQHRNQRKFYLEMCNALGLIEGKWNEPRVYSREVEQAYPLPSDSLFARGLNVAAKAHDLLDRRAPRIGATFHAPGLTILRTPESAWPPEALVDHGVVTTPESLDLLLQTQCPALWLHHGQALSALGFDPPSRMAWIRSARRLAGSLWLRGPGFFEARNGYQEQRVRLAGHILDALDRGLLPPPLPPADPTTLLSGRASAYYLGIYDGLAAEAASLRKRAEVLEERIAAAHLS